MEALPLPNPARVEHIEGNKYMVTLEPMYPGYGVTIGNALRRVLLSSMPGAAVTGVKIKFVDHEFSTIPNVKEDVIQIILNLKQLRLKSASAEPVRLSLKAKGEGVVTAAQIQETDQVQVVNKDLHIATLDNKNADFDMELIVEQGRGYVPVEAREVQKSEVGMLGIDAIYTPVRSVFFDVTNVRVGQITNFDKLSLNLETDGTISGEEVMDIASHILVDHFTMMFNRSVITEDQVSPVESMPELATDDEQPMIAPEIVEGTSLDELQLSNRAKNALMKNGIATVEALRALSDDDINNIAGLGEKTINEIMEVLKR
jgi:DNA-directed RNA polymerase subunit alpha